MNPNNSGTRRARIMIVEGEAGAARDVREQLTDLGYEPVGDTTRGEDALVMAERLRPDLVLMDAPSAGTAEGITAARQLRDRVNLPVVFLTAFNGAEMLECAKLAEPLGFLVKPVTPADLRAVIEMSLYKWAAEQRVRASEARYKALVESVHEGIITTDGVGQIISWNRGAQEIFGLTEAEAVGQPMISLIAERSHSIYTEAVHRVLQGGDPAGREQVLNLRGRRQDGHEFPFELSLAQWSTAEGHFVTAIIRDISERKQVEQRVRLQSTALEAAVNSVVITDAKGNIEWVNPAFCRISGYELAEVVGQNPRVLKSGHQPAAYYAAMWQTITTGRSWQGEFVNRRKDGTLYTESVSITAVKDDTGAVAHFIAIKQDITALKESLVRLKVAHGELAAKNRALDEALIEARAAVEAKSTFLSTMSHELRTPMNGVIGMTGLLRSTEPLTREQEDFIDTISACGETLLTLINDVLDYSKIEANHLELECQPFDLRSCLDEVLDTVAIPAREKHLDLAAEIDASVPLAVVGDGLRLRQVLTNLVGNAVKFTANGEVVIELRAAPAGPDLQRLFFKVRDTGIGIPAEKLDRLFKSFSQVDTSTTRVYGGTGLGLAISQRLVGLMGGIIRVASEPGRGSEFSFDVSLPPAPSFESAAADRTPADWAGRSILIVDDNATNRRIFSTQLRRAGCHTVEQASGAEALAWLGDHAWPDLIISDMLMPGMDGLDFVLNVRSIESERDRAPAVPVILVSSGGYRPSDPRTPAAQLSVVLSKPLRQAQLFDAVARAIQNGSAARKSPQAGPSGAALTHVAQLHPHRLLLVEDNAVNRKVALAMLARLGYRADTAADGAQACEACRVQSYDLIFMDVRMPNVDGLEGTRRIRQLAGRAPRIVAMTANAMEGDRETCLAAGMDDYIPKPVKMEDLLRALTFAGGPTAGTVQ